MPFLNETLWSRIPHHLKGIMSYYPDVILFKLSQDQYNQYWQRLFSAPYIYADDTTIRPAGWFTFIFQSIKGWLGFNNYCQPKRVSYGLSKLAYYGYTHGFAQPEFHNLIPSEISSLVKTPFSSSTTAQLQQKLLISYCELEDQLIDSNEYFQKIDVRHRFGDSWLQINAPDVVPSLDPQDESLIKECIRKIDDTPPGSFIFLQNSKYAQMAAQYYAGKARNTEKPSFLSSIFWDDPRPSLLESALNYNAAIAQKDADLFVTYYIDKKKYKEAMSLIPMVENPTAVVAFLKQVPEFERQNLIEKNSPTAALLAKYYLSQKQYSLAQAIYSKLEELDPGRAFILAVKAKNYPEAYELFKKFETAATFSSSDRKTVAQHFINNAEKEYKSGETLQKQKMWEESKIHYHNSSIQMQMAFHLHSSEDYQKKLAIHKRRYAQLLIESDKDLHAPETSDVAVVTRAITLLKSFETTNKEEQHQQRVALTDALMRRVDTLREKICFHHTPSDTSRIAEHIKLHQKEITALIKTLDELIQLLKNTKDQGLKIHLGKAYFLHADLHHFFGIPSPEMHQNYRNAQESAPKNPFYALRASEIFTEEKDKFQNIGIPGVKELGFEMIDYVNWFDERWVKRADIIRNIKDIHIQNLKDYSKSSFDFNF